MKFTKGNTIGLETRFGDAWTGIRCGARTKAGTECKRPAVKGVGRCTRHGGRSTGAKTELGKMNIAAAKTVHGNYSKRKRLEAKHRAQAGRKIRAELAEIESWALANGYLHQKWRDKLY
jgi:hypothetical protein